MKKINTICLFFFTVTSFFSFGQGESASEKKKEFFLSITDFSPFELSIIHKREIKENLFIKFGLVDLSLQTNSNFSKNIIRSSISYAIGLEAGIEFRKPVTENFTFYHGPNISFSYSNLISRIDTLAIPAVKTPSFTGAIPYTIGMLVHLKEHFLLAAEINPGVAIGYNKYAGNNYNISANINFSNRFALLSLVYRI